MIYNNLPEEILSYIYKIALHKIHINTILNIIENYESHLIYKKQNTIYYKLLYLYTYTKRFNELINNSPIKFNKTELNLYYSVINKNLWHNNCIIN